MSKDMTNKLRADCEKLIYQVFDAIDPSKTNSEHYKQVFSKMSNEQFKKYISQKFPYRLHVRPFEIEPKMADAKKALDILGVPLLEKITEPFVYTDDKGRPVSTKEALVGPIHLKKVQQFVTKKNSYSVNIGQRDMKSGLLISHDKNGKESDRELEALSIMGLTNTMKEFTTIRADYMDAKSEAYNTINTIGSVSLEDLDIHGTDSLAKNMMNAYLIGAGLYSDMLNTDYYLPYTLTNKKKEIERK